MKHKYVEQSNLSSNTDCRILLTGAAGFLGRNLYLLLSEMGHSILPVIRSRLADAPFDQNKVVNQDICDIEEIPESIETIIHCAASPLRPRSYLKDNINATRSLISLAKRSCVKLFIFCSAMSVYGEVDCQIVREDTPVRNPGRYGYSKLISERLLLNASDLMQIIVLRMPGIIGPGAHRNWLSQLKAGFLGGNDIFAYNLDALFNNAVHVGDLANMIHYLVSDIRNKNRTGIYNLAASGEITIDELLQIFLTETGGTSHIIDLKEDKASWIISIDKAKELLLYNPMDISSMVQKYIRE